MRHCSLGEGNLALLERGYCNIEGAHHNMGWLQRVGSIKLQVSVAKEPYKRDYILHKRPIIESILLTVATPY